MSIKLFTVFPYYPFNGWRIFRDASVLFLIFIICIYSHFLFVSLAKVSSIFFLKNKLALPLIFFSYCFLLFSFIDSTLLFPFFFLWVYFSNHFFSFLRWKIDQNLRPFPFSNVSIQSYKFINHHSFSWILQILYFHSHLYVSLSLLRSLL